MITLTRDISPVARFWRNDLECYLTCRQVLPVSEEHHKKWLQRIEEDPSIEMFGVTYRKEEDAHEMTVGQCGLTSISYPHGHAEYSLLIGPPYQGRGYACEALKNLLMYAFDQMRLHLVWGEIIANNPKGLKIAEKVGFKEEAVLRDRYFKQGQYFDSYIVSITEDEWRNLHS